MKPVVVRRSGFTQSTDFLIFQHCPVAVVRGLCSASVPCLCAAFQRFVGDAAGAVRAVTLTPALSPALFHGFSGFAFQNKKVYVFHVLSLCCFQKLDVAAMQQTLAFLKKKAWAGEERSFGYI